MKCKFWSPELLNLVPYTPGEQPKINDLIKLNTNENPYPPTPRINSLLKHFTVDHLRRYPDPQSSELTSTIAQYYGVDNSNVFIGNGSDEVLAHTFMAFFRQDAPILMPDISYSFYTVYCDLYNIDFKPIPIEDDFSISLEKYNIANGGIVFANPNAPTGHTLALSEIEELLIKNQQSLVVVDEAYVDFGAQSAIELTKKYDNCLVIQTLSKSRSLAGLRIGFAIGSAHLIAALDRVKNSFNSYPLDMLAQASAIAAFADENYFKVTIAKVIATRNWTHKQLTALQFSVIPSNTNFLLVKHDSIQAIDIMEFLRDRKIIVRHFSTQRINNYLRISIGTDEQMQTLVDTLNEMITA
ncbi:MAG: histidinol-phosphate transaminase [Oceanospirillaceae bacterium]